MLACLFGKGLHNPPAELSPQAKQACKQSECKQGQGMQGVQNAHAGSHRGVCEAGFTEGVLTPLLAVGY